MRLHGVMFETLRIKVVAERAKKGRTKFVEIANLDRCRDGLPDAKHARHWLFANSPLIKTATCRRQDPTEGPAVVYGDRVNPVPRRIVIGACRSALRR